MSDINNEFHNKKKGLGRGLGSLLQTHAPETVKPTEEKPVIPKTSAPPVQPITAPARPVAPSTPAVSPAAATTAKPVAATAPAANAPPLELAGQQDKMWTLSIEKLRSGKYQPRKNFEKQALEELSNSIKQHGILQPLVVRSVGNGQFEIIAGERRWRAAQAAGLHEVPVIIKSFDNQKTLELSLIENLQRADLNPIEEAEGYQRLMNEFHLTQERVAEKVGKERATVTNALRLLKLTPEVRTLLIEGQISQGHAKVLLGLLDPKDQKELAQAVVQNGLSVRKLEEQVQKKLKPAAAEDTSGAASESVTNRLIAGLSDEMQKLLGTRVSIDYNKGKGKMSIYYYSDDELTQIIEKVRSGVKS